MASKNKIYHIEAKEHGVTRYTRTDTGKLDFLPTLCGMCDIEHAVWEVYYETSKRRHKNFVCQTCLDKLKRRSV